MGSWGLNGADVGGYRKAVLLLIAVSIVVLALYCATMDDSDVKMPAVAESRESVPCLLADEVREKLGLSEFYQKSVAIDGL